MPDTQDCAMLRSSSTVSSILCLSTSLAGRLWMSLAIRATRAQSPLAIAILRSAKLGMMGLTPPRLETPETPDGCSAICDEEL